MNNNDEKVIKRLGLWVLALNDAIEELNLSLDFKFDLLKKDSTISNSKVEIIKQALIKSAIVTFMKIYGKGDPSNDVFGNNTKIIKDIRTEIIKKVFIPKREIHIFEKRFNLFRSNIIAHDNAKQYSLKLDGNDLTYSLNNDDYYYFKIDSNEITNLISTLENIKKEIIIYAQSEYGFSLELRLGIDQIEYLKSKHSIQ